MFFALYLYFMGPNITMKFHAGAQNFGEMEMLNNLK